MCIGQESKELSILSGIDNWRKEIIQFPIDWAPNLLLEGFEELRFAPQWSNPGDDQFWTLVMSWKVNADSPLTLKQIEYNLESYFDGVMKPNHWASTFPRPNVLLESDSANNNVNSSTGKMKFFDGFHTGKLTTLYIQGEQHFCSKHLKTIIIFRLSPKDFNHIVWGDLKKIKQKPGYCE